MKGWLYKVDFTAIGMPLFFFVKIHLLGGCNIFFLKQEHLINVLAFLLNDNIRLVVKNVILAPEPLSYTRPVGLKIDI